MKINDLVKFLVAPFLEEDTNLEYDGSVIPDKESTNYPIKKKKKKVNTKTVYKNTR